MSQAPNPAESGVVQWGAIGSSITLCLSAAVGTDILVTFMAYLNTRLGDGFPWFIAPAFALSWSVMRRSRRWYQPLAPIRLRSTPICVLTGVLFGIGIAGAGLLSMASLYHDAFVHGRIAVPGDQYHTTAAVRAGISLTVPIMGPFYEEAGVRGALQFRLQHLIGPLWAEVLAGIAFVALHGFVIAERPWQIPFIAFAAFANGRLAALTQTVRFPVLSHALSNAILMVTYATLRGMNGYVSPP
jgi:membrane protease YdiL (CAAX protease family)